MDFVAVDFDFWEVFLVSAFLGLFGLHELHGLSAADELPCSAVEDFYDVAAYFAAVDLFSFSQNVHLSDRLITEAPLYIP